MTQEEIVELMKQSMPESVFEDLYPHYIEEFTAFAALVEAKTKEKDAA